MVIDVGRWRCCCWMARSWLPLGFRKVGSSDEVTVSNVRIHSTIKMKSHCTNMSTSIGLRYPSRVKIMAGYGFNVRNTFLDSSDKSVVGRDWSWVSETRRGQGSMLAAAPRFTSHWRISSGCPSRYTAPSAGKNPLHSCCYLADVH